jgi:hypothetical protein
VRSRVEWVASGVFVAVTMAAGAVAVVAPVWLQGFVLGGSACGGGGNEMRCTGITRQLSLVEVSPRAWGYVAGGVLCILLGAAALLLTRNRSARIALSAAVLSVAFIGLVQTTQTDVKLGPSSQGATYGRATEDWGAFLAPTLLEQRRDALRRYEGRLTEPGGPLYDRELILDSFFVRPQDGWRFLRAAIVVLFFAAGLETVRRLIRRPVLAVVTTATAGMLIWARIVERATPCDPGASACYDGLLTIYAVAAVGAVWAVYFAGVFVGRIAGRASWGARFKRED